MFLILVCLDVCTVFSTDSVIGCQYSVLDIGMFGCLYSVLDIGMFGCLHCFQY